MTTTAATGMLVLVFTLLASATSFTVCDLSWKTRITFPQPTGTCYRSPFPRTTNILFSITDENTEPSSMRIKAIKDELKSNGISFTDCFDKDSLVERLIDARSGKVAGTKCSTTATASVSSSEDTNEAKSQNTSTSLFDKEAVSAELRTKKVRELRTMCAQNNIRWANMIEKEELVQALVKFQEKASNFSPSGKLTPGKVTTIDQDVLAKEVAPGAATTPLLLDVYATWCGPVSAIAICKTFLLRHILERLILTCSLYVHTGLFPLHFCHDAVQNDESIFGRSSVGTRR